MEFPPRNELFGERLIREEILKDWPEGKEKEREVRRLSADMLREENRAVGK